MVLPELFLRTVPFQGGLDVLSGFSKSDNRYLDLLFIAVFVIAPVNKIVSILMSIADDQNIWDNRIRDKKLKDKNKIKVKVLLRHWYTMQYLKALKKYQPAESIENRETKQKDEQKILPGLEYYVSNYLNQSARFGKLGLLPIILFNMPREFQRWKDYYGQEDKNITSVVHTWRLTWNRKYQEDIGLRILKFMKKQRKKRKVQMMMQQTAHSRQKILLTHLLHHHVKMSLIPE